MVKITIVRFLSFSLINSTFSTQMSDFDSPSAGILTRSRGSVDESKSHISLSSSSSSPKHIVQVKTDKVQLSVVHSSITVGDVAAKTVPSVK